MFNLREVNSNKTHEWLNTFKVVFSSCRRSLHCKYLLASNIHSRIFACTVFSFIAFLFFFIIPGFGLFLFVEQSPSGGWGTVWATVQKGFRGRRLETNSACETAVVGTLLIEALQCYVRHPHRVFLGTKVKFLFSWWNIDVVPCMCLEVELTM